jgi:HEAT repeat protein
MARTAWFVLLAFVCIVSASTAQVHPTERDEILKAINELASSNATAAAAAREVLLDKGDAAVPFLLDALKHAGSEAVRMGVAGVLGELRNRDAVTPLFVAAQVDTSPRVRMAAQIALDQLVADLNDPHIEDTRRRAYEKVTHDALVELKRVLRQSDDATERARAARSIGIYGDERDLDTLYSRAKNDTSPAVRIACFEAIRRLTYPLVLARDFQALSWDPPSRPHNAVAVSATAQFLALLDDEKDADVRVAIVKNLAEIVYPIFLLGERRFRDRRGPFDDHRHIIEEVTDEFRRDLENGEDTDVKIAEVEALIHLLSAYYRVGDVDVQDEIRRRLTSEYRRVFLEGANDYRTLIVRVRLDRYYRSTPPKNDALAESLTRVLRTLYSDEGNWRLRRLAAEAIGLFGDSSDSVAIIRGLEKEQNHDVWEAAIDALGLLDRASSATFLLNTVYLGPKAPTRLRAAAARAVGRIHYPQETRRLAALLLKEQDADVLVAGAEALSYYRDPATAAVLLQMLRHTAPEVRAAALEALRYNPDANSRQAIETLLFQDPDPSVRAAAATTLSALGGPSEIPTLIKALENQSAEVRRAVAVELGILRRVRASETLVLSKSVDALIAVATSDPDAEVRIQAATSLGQLGDPKAIEPLVSHLPDEKEADARQAVYDALLAFRKPSMVIVSINSKLPVIQRDDPALYAELQELLVDLNNQLRGSTLTPLS